MSSFKLYLPSNACPDVYPNNTPADFRTVLDKPIELEGNWEVGLESICYSPQIHDDESEKATITLFILRVHRPLINDDHKIRYHLNADNSWAGFLGVKPRRFESNLLNVKNVLRTLNSLNDLIVISGSVFQFRFNEHGHIVYECSDPGFFITLRPHLAYLLGFYTRSTFGMCTSIKPRKMAPFVPQTQEEPMMKVLEWEDYHVRYLHTELQSAIGTVTLKRNGEPFDGRRESLMKMWQTHLAYSITLEFKVTGELMLSGFKEDLAFVFSPAMQRTFYLSGPLIGESRMMSTWPFKPSNFTNATNEHWYVTVYSTKMRTKRVVERFAHPLSLSLRKFNTIPELLISINGKVKTKLVSILKKNYHSRRHHCSLRLLPSKHVALRLGSRIELEFSRNLGHLLGFPTSRLFRSRTQAEREVDNLFNRSRQLHVMTNIVQATAVGGRQLQILRDFLHTPSRETLSVKHFDTISYIPVNQNRLDSIHIQIVDDRNECVQLKDVKTLLTLYFQKI